MASSVNNIAATFSKIPKKPSSSSPPPSSSSSAPPPSISTFWNPHATIRKSQRLSLVNLYGPPGPPRTNNSNNNIRTISTVRASINYPGNSAVNVDNTVIGRRVPNVTVSCLGRNGAVQAVSLWGLCKGKRRVAIVGLSAAFSPACSRFVRAVESGRARRGWDLIACVAANDVFVMRAWGEHLAVGESVVMLSDGGGELAAAIGVSAAVDTRAGGGLGLQPMRFCASVVNGVITGVDFDDGKES